MARGGGLDDVAGHRVLDGDGAATRLDGGVHGVVVGVVEVVARPVVVGLVVDRLGYRTGFAVSGVLLLAAVVPWIVAREPRQAADRVAAGE